MARTQGEGGIALPLHALSYFNSTIISISTA